MSRWAPLRRPAYRRLAGAYTLSRFGDILALVALAVIVYDRTGSTLATTALFVALELLPALFAPALTARLDRIPIGRVLPVLYVLEAAIFVALAALTHHFTLAPFLVLVAVDGAIGVATRALCRGAIATDLEPAGQLRRGNALLNMALSPSMAVGGLAGGVLVTVLGGDVALLLNAGSFLVAASLVGFARGLPRYDADGDEDDEHWRARLAAAMRYLRGNRLAFTLIVADSVALAFFAMSEPIEVAYTRDALSAGASGYGALIAAWGGGVMVGSAVYAWVGQQRLAAAAILGTLVQAVSYLALAGAPTIELACAAAVVGGAANGAQIAAVATAIQEAIALEFQARVMSLYESAVTAIPGLGFVAGGALAAVAGERLAFTVAGAGVLVTLAAVLALRPWRPSARPVAAAAPVAAAPAAANSGGAILR